MKVSLISLLALASSASAPQAQAAGAGAGHILTSQVQVTSQGVQRVVDATGPISVTFS